VTLVVDAGFVVAALVDDGPLGRWPTGVGFAGGAPPDAGRGGEHPAPRLRRAGDRGWELRGSVTAYDACYVALAEGLDAPLATIDVRLSCAPGLTCAFEQPQVTAAGTGPR